MAHVVTQSCCGDGSCVFACPVNAIHPTPDEPDFATAEMLYIDPVSCVDCGACVTACPVGAIAPVGKLTEAQLPFVDINALFHEDRRARDDGTAHPPQAPVLRSSRWSVAKAAGRDRRIGSGGALRRRRLLKRRDAQVSVFDRLPTPYGLVRAGVAPDHQSTKQVETLFRQIEDQPGFSYFLNVDIGTTIDHDDLAAHHHAVIYATGASHDRRLDIPGEGCPASRPQQPSSPGTTGIPITPRPSSTSATSGSSSSATGTSPSTSPHPDDRSRSSWPPTDIADHALEALRRGAVREVVLLGRRGAAQAAFTLPERRTGRPRRHPDRRRR
ncbi:4Fe-4S binding protein [Aeromicrobium sp. UC242_57]|uniref:4Fe-4S binding protein n=1 Tax=Aeromicrobium sp. UC242_57 TaxID=3374624 RepID=UPI003793B52E